MFPKVALAVLAVVRLMSCDGTSIDPALTGILALPDPVVMAPELSYLGFRQGWFAGDPAAKRIVPFVVDFSDTELSWQQYERLQVVFETSGGDREEVVQGSGVCRARARELFDCSSFLVAMDAGHTIDELAPLINATGGDIESRFPDGGGSVRLREGDLAAAMTKARTWPDVRHVEHNLAGSVDDIPERMVFLDTTFTMSRGPVVQEDGVLQIAPGDEVHIRYRQPSGSDLVATAVSN